MKTLLLTRPMPPGYFASAIRAVAPELTLIEYSRELSDAQLAEIDVVLGWQWPPELVTRLPRLRWVCAVSAGVDKLLVPGLPPAVSVSRIVDAAQAEGIAQFVALMALRHARRLPMYEAQQGERRWERHPVDKVRSRVAVLGTGAMGGVIARLLSAVGFDVQGWSRRSPLDLPSLLAASDIVVCALPLTPATRGILDARAFAQMPAGSYLINVARGEHVVEPDLIDALRGGRLAGAALDVQCREPLPPDDPLWDVAGLTLTPHIAAQPSPETIAEQFVQGLRALRSGQAPANVIDREAGY